MISKQAYAHMQSPHGVEPVVPPDLVGRSGHEGQGPFYEITLKLTDGTITGASFRTVGCPWSNGIGSALTKLAEGKTPPDAFRITEADVEKELGGVPRDKIHYLPLAIQALRNAL
jgi:NifU-like protein